MKSPTNKVRISALLFWLYCVAMVLFACFVFEVMTRALNFYVYGMWEQLLPAGMTLCGAPFFFYLLWIYADRLHKDLERHDKQ